MVVIDPVRLLEAANLYGSVDYEHKVVFTDLEKLRHFLKEDWSKDAVIVVYGGWSWRNIE